MDWNRFQRQKAYEISFHAEDYAHRAAVQPATQGILAGKASLVTKPDQAVKAFLYYFEGPAEQNHHDVDYRYNIRIECPNTWVNFRGVLFENAIHMDYVEPRTTAIDPESLFGKDCKSDLGLQGGVVVTNGNYEVSYQIEYYGDVEWALRTLETELESNGTSPDIGPSNLGNRSYYSHSWGHPDQAAALSFVRDNVLIHIQAHNPNLESPEATKSIFRGCGLQT